MRKFLHLLKLPLFRLLVTLAAFIILISCGYSGSGSSGGSGGSSCNGGGSYGSGASCALVESQLP